MSFKKVLGWIFIVAAAWVSLGALTQLSSLAKGLIGIYVWITRGLDAARAGEAAGNLFFWGCLISVIITLWRSGLKMVRDNGAETEQTR